MTAFCTRGLSVRIADNGPAERIIIRAAPFTLAADHRSFQEPGPVMVQQVADMVQVEVGGGITAPGSPVRWRSGPA